jgi:hypothetical protein
LLQERAAPINRSRLDPAGQKLKFAVVGLLRVAGEGRRFVLPIFALVYPLTGRNSFLCRLIVGGELGVDEGWQPGWKHQ